MICALLSAPAFAQVGGRAGAGAASGANTNTGVFVPAAKPSNDDPSPPTDVPVLYLQSNDWLAGKPVAAAQADRFGWQSPAFTEPFEFDLPVLTRVRFPASATRGWRDHEYRLELSGGDVLYGELVSIGDENLMFRSSLAGELRVKRSAVRCLERCKANALVYLGPNGLAEWETPRGPDTWQEDEGQLVTDKDLASLYSKIELPPRALIEFEVSSLFPPVFRLALGVEGEPAGRHKGFRLEVVDLDVIAVYETDSDIDVARVMTLTPGPERDRVHVRVLLDQDEQRAEVFSAEGVPLASVHIGGNPQVAVPGILLEHKRGGLRLERLRVWRWTGSLPPSLAGNRPQLHRVDGTVVNCKPTGYDAAKRQFVLSTDEGEVTCTEDEVARIYFGDPAPPEDRPLRVACADGTQLGGWFAGISNERLLLDCKSIDAANFDSIGVAVAAISNITCSYGPAAESSSADRALVMRLDGGRVHGKLTPCKAEAGHSALSWQPAGSAKASPLRDDAAAHVAAQSLARFESTRKMTASGRASPNQAEPASLVRQPEDRSKAARYDMIYLTTGDTFRCMITNIDERGVECRTTSAEKQIAHDKVKAIDLATPAGSPAQARPTFEDFARHAINGQVRSPQLEREKLERLLTLPRLRRDDPPTQILCAVNGDYLRGRLLGMSESVVQFAVDDDRREFPRDRIAAIVWLHPQQTKAEEEQAEPADMAITPNLAHAVCSDGTRITFTATEIDANSILGVSDVLGECSLPLDRLNELFVGERVRQAATKVAYHGWTLTPAIDPKAFQESDSPADAGKDSALVGLPAPDFDLTLLDGTKFRLSQQKGKTVVLDFWASWCEPCIRSLPKLAQTVAAMEEGQVKLIAVNVQESRDDAEAVRERMKLDIAVGLDRDGTVAGRYAASSFPYTIVVGPDGKVARVFVGTSADIEKQMQAALKEVTATE